MQDQSWLLNSVPKGRFPFEFEGYIIVVDPIGFRYSEAHGLCLATEHGVRSFQPEEPLMFDTESTAR